MRSDTLNLLAATARRQVEQADEAEKKAGELEKEAMRLRQAAGTARAIAAELGQVSRPSAPPAARDGGSTPQAPAQKPGRSARPAGSTPPAARAELGR